MLKNFVKLDLLIRCMKKQTDGYGTFTATIQENFRAISWDLSLKVAARA